MFSLKKIMTLAAPIALAFGMSAPTSAKAQASPFLGQTMVVGFNFCPRGWAKADGQLMAISSNSALFSLLGTIYGGDGRTTFALPDLRGRSMINSGTGPGLQNRRLGARSGAQTKTLNVTEMPSHNHMVNAANAEIGFADHRGPASDFMGAPDYNDPANPAPDINIYSDKFNVQMDPRMITNTGGGQSFSIEDPYLVMTVCIAMQGIYPSRN
ncbi:MAG: phage tail protein [Sulfitobacter sp.]